MIQCKNLTNAIIYVHTTLFTLLHSYMFQVSGANLRDSQHNMCPDANIWKSEYIYMEVKLTTQYKI